MDVVVGRGRLDGFEGEIGGEGPADEVGDDCGERVDEVEESEEGDDAEDRVGLGYLCALLNVAEDRVLCELRRVVSDDGDDDDDDDEQKKRTSLSSWSM